MVEFFLCDNTHIKKFFEFFKFVSSRNFYEQLLAWNPEYIILASDASYTAEDVLADPNLKNCTAVALGNVFSMPNSAEAWDSPVPSGILGALWLANVLHEDLVSDEVCTAKIDEYYETFYDFTYSEN